MGYNSYRKFGSYSWHLIPYHFICIILLTYPQALMFSASEQLSKMTVHSMSCNSFWIAQEWKVVGNYIEKIIIITFPEIAFFSYIIVLYMVFLHSEAEKALNFVENKKLKAQAWSVRRISEWGRSFGGACLLKELL